MKLHARTRIAWERPCPDLSRDMETIARLKQIILSRVHTAHVRYFALDRSIQGRKVGSACVSSLRAESEVGHSCLPSDLVGSSNPATMEAASVGGLFRLADTSIEVDDLAPIESGIDVANAAAFGAAKMRADRLPRPIRQAVGPRSSLGPIFGRNSQA